MRFVEQMGLEHVEDNPNDTPAECYVRGADDCAAVFEQAIMMGYTSGEISGDVEQLIQLMRDVRNANIEESKTNEH